MLARRIRMSGARLARNRRGSVSIEFALAAWPLFLMIIPIFELGVMLTREAVLYGAMYEGARQLRTGVVQNTGETYNDEKAEEKFTEIVCDNLFDLVDCSDIAYDVRTFKKYDDVELDDLGTGSDGMPKGTVFDPGGATDITTVRIYSQHKFVTPFLGKFFNDDDVNGRLLMYTMIVKGEPWD
ncbi:TadE/TadG family type IV pilus assembly protein [Roseospira visakhapatnamensis]|uniref:TadE-like domain-containing protein n=1 Tax=Roseospira visakhapatnamensis TaxID=390880 RepID=A0A7W6W9P7_9PROT|nr:TadE/TadG family type IV pilus assembly protein [Roseospira visakhapatnamensis]MBB4266360.1 hypothetical protein [Roseospira visakhapatnamensis]